MKDFEIINLSDRWSKVGSWDRRDPYTMLFVYTASGRKILIKGGIRDCKEAVETLREPCVIHYTYWYKGESRGGVKAENFPNDIGVYFRQWTDGKKILVYEKVYDVFRSGKTYLEKKVKRFPRCFPKELQQFVGNM